MNKTETEGLGRRLREIRKRLGLSQEEMAKRLGLTQYNSVRRYESGERVPDHSKLVVYARLGETTVDALLGVEDYEEQRDVERDVGEFGDAVRFQRQRRGSEVALIEQIRDLYDRLAEQMRTSDAKDEVISKLKTQIADLWKRVNELEAKKRS